MKRFAILISFLLVVQISFSQCIGDCENDYGILMNSDTDFYKGFFKEGVKNGLGYEVNASGYYYGQFKNGLRDGMGVFSDDKGSGYGRWKDGKKSGWHGQIEDGNFNVADYQNGVENQARVVPGVWDLPQESKCMFGDCVNGFGSYFYYDYGAIAEGFWMKGELLPFSIYKNFRLATNSAHYKDLNLKLDGSTLMIEEYPDEGYTMISEIIAATGTPKGKMLIFYSDGYSKVVEVDGDTLVRTVFEGTTENLVKD